MNVAQFQEKMEVEGLKNSPQVTNKNFVVLLTTRLVFPKENLVTNSLCLIPQSIIKSRNLELKSEKGKGFLNKLQLSNKGNMKDFRNWSIPASLLIVRMK